MIDIFVVPSSDLPLVDAQVVLGTGGALDPVDLPGLARHATELMTRGAAGRSRAEMDAAFDDIGASFGAYPDHDSVVFAVRCLSRHLPEALDLFAQSLARATFEPAEHEKLVRESLAALDELQDDDSSLCTRFFNHLVLPDHAYGRSLLGTRESLGRLSRDASHAWSRTHVTRSNLYVGFAGQVDDQHAQELGATLVSGLPEGAPLDTRGPPEPRFAAQRRCYLVDKPDRTQSQILVGHPSPARAHADWLALHVASTVFGGMFTSRLMTEVRVKRGWSYGASSRLSRARGGRSFRLRVHPSAEQTADTLALVFSLWEDIVAHGIRSDELDFAKNYIAGGWPFTTDTAEKRLDRLVDVRILNLPHDEYDTFLARLADLSCADVNQAIARWWRPQSAVTVLTATASDMLPRLGPLDLGEVTVLPFDSY